MQDQRFYILSSHNQELNLFKAESGSNFKLGVVGGISFPVLPFRVWIGANFENVSYPLQDSSKANQFQYTNSGWSGKLGLGWKIFPLISFNAEYIFGKLTSHKITGDQLTQFSDLSSFLRNHTVSMSHALVLSLSLPI